MTLKDNHRKHVDLVRPGYGEFGRNELAILGSPCNTINQLATSLISQLGPEFSVAYVDADHKGEGDSEEADGNDFKGSVRFIKKCKWAITA